MFRHDYSFWRDLGGKSVLSLLFLLAGNASLSAGEILGLDVTRHGSVLKEAFKELLPPLQHYVLRVEINGKDPIPGTLIDAKAGYAVAKASELGECLDSADRFRCLTTQEDWLPARYLGYLKDLDLVVLQLEFPTENSLPAVKRAEEMLAGQWVISLGFNQKQPLGVGVLGATPREIESGKGYAGLTVDETQEGLQVLQVMANSGAAYAGLKKGDLLLKEDETPAMKRNWLAKKFNTCDPGDWCSLFAIRDGEILPINLRMGISWDNLVDRQAMMNRFGSDVSQRRTGFRSVFQHDTLMHPRECGGPVVNMQGELLGINIARAGRTDTYAIPVEVILESIEDLQADE